MRGNRKGRIIEYKEASMNVKNKTKTKTKKLFFSFICKIFYVSCRCTCMKGVTRGQAWLILLKSLAQMI